MLPKRGLSEGTGSKGRWEGGGGPRRPLGASQINITVSFYEQQSLLLIAALMASALSRRKRERGGEEGRDKWEVASMPARLLVLFQFEIHFVCLAKV